MRLCSTPAVYAVACLASSQPAAIFDCTGSTIDLAMEAIDETTAAPVEPRRCGGWEAAMLWAAAIASIATMVRWGLAGGVPSIQCVTDLRVRVRPACVAACARAAIADRRGCHESARGDRLGKAIR